MIQGPRLNWQDKKKKRRNDNRIKRASGLSRGQALLPLLWMVKTVMTALRCLLLLLMISPQTNGPTKAAKVENPGAKIKEKEEPKAAGRVRIKGRALAMSR